MSWTKHVASAVLVVLAVAISARAAWELLAPLVPTLAAITMLTIIYIVIFGRRSE